MKNPSRTLPALLFAAALAAFAASARAADPAQGTEPAAAPADAIVASGTLSRDKDCQRLRTPSGETYVLIGRLTEATPGTRIRVAGRRRGRTACGEGPSILVESVGPERLEPAARQPGEPAAPAPGMVGQPVHQLDDAAKLGKAKRLQVTGTLTREGVECPVLRTAKGRIYTLAGDLKGWKTGDRVTVTGALAQGSTCQQGTTIDVQDVRRPR